MVQHPTANLVTVAIVICLLATTGIATVAGGESSALTHQSTAATEIDSCTTISESGYYVLTSDITNSAEDACIKIQSSDVVLDGQGHTIDGVQNETSLETFVSAGYGIPVNVSEVNATEDTANVSDAANQTNVTLPYPNPSDPQWANVGIASNASTSLSNVTVTGVTVQEFFFGVFYNHTHGAMIQDVTVTNNGDGLELYNATRTVVTASTITENRWGVATSNVSDSTLRGLDAQSNEQTALYLYNSTNLVVRDNNASQNGDSGILLDSTNNSSLRDNVANANEFGGIPVLFSTNNTLNNNTASGNGHDGISLQYNSTGNVLTNNVVTNTTGADEITAATGYSSGLLVTNGSHSNVIRDTTAANNTNWTYYSANTTGTNTVENLTIDREFAVTFTGQDIAVAPVESRSMAAAADRTLPRVGLVIADTSPNASVRGLDVTFTPSGTTVEERVFEGHSSSSSVRRPILTMMPYTRV